MDEDQMSKMGMGGRRFYEDDPQAPPKEE